MKWRRHKTFLISLMIISWFSFGLVEEAGAWWDTHYLYRKHITITNNDPIQLGCFNLETFVIFA